MVHSREREKLENEKKKRFQLEQNEAEGKEVLAMNKQMDQLNTIELEKLKIWHNVKKKR